MDIVVLRGSVESGVSSTSQPRISTLHLIEVFPSCCEGRWNFLRSSIDYCLCLMMNVDVGLEIKGLRSALRCSAVLMLMNESVKEAGETTRLLNQTRHAEHFSVLLHHSFAESQKQKKNLLSSFNWI